eukprot:7694151-Alexandrium_andersonii.AAC.1
MGLPGLGERDQAKVELGNRLMKAGSALIVIALSRRLVGGAENPVSSRLWLCPPLQKIESHPASCTIVTDFCQWGERWRKRTKLLL